MSISDDLMWRYYELCTDVSLDGIRQMKALVEQGKLHPKKAKEGLAMRIIADFHDESAARDAQAEFQRVFGGGGVPDEVPEHRFEATDGKLFLPELLARTQLAASKSEAQRLLRQGAVRVEDERIEPGVLELTVQAGSSYLIKVGKRRFARVTIV